MIKCNLCGKIKNTKREMHGHLIRVHEEEYRKCNLKMEYLTEYIIDPESGKPSGLRFLNLSDREEKAMYDEGYSFIDDDDMCYTSEEAKGWL